jgi:hypothetical protein
MFGYIGNMELAQKMFSSFFGLFQAPLILRVSNNVPAEALVSY